MPNYLRGVNTKAGVAVSERQSGMVTILGLEGNVTFGDGTAALRRETRRLIAEGRADLLLDLSRVRYVDSSGVRDDAAGAGL